MSPRAVLRLWLHRRLAARCRDTLRESLKGSNPRAPSTTPAPRSASKSVVALPMPLLAPVITTTLASIPDMKAVLSNYC
jgi:hypothetical protein